MNILFICTGNTCRSPMAAALARHHFAEEELSWQADSAGLYAMPGQPMARFAADALIRRQVVVTAHASKPVTHELLHDADAILTMTMLHKEDLVQQYPEFAGKVYTLSEFAEEDDVPVDVHDPIGGSAETYETCALELDNAIQKVILKLKSRRTDG